MCAHVASGAARPENARMDASKLGKIGFTLAVGPAVFVAAMLLLQPG